MVGCCRLSLYWAEARHERGRLTTARLKRNKVERLRGTGLCMYPFIHSRYFACGEEDDGESNSNGKRESYMVVGLLISLSGRTQAVIFVMARMTGENNNNLRQHQ